MDFAIGSMLDVPMDISYTPMYTFDPALIMPLDHELADKEDLTLEDIAPYGLILPPRRLTTWRLVDRVFQQHRVPFNVVLEVGGWEVIKALRGSRVRSVHRHQHLSARGRPAHRPQHEPLFPETDLRGREPPGPAPAPSGAKLHRFDPGRADFRFTLAHGRIHALKRATAQNRGSFRVSDSA